MRWKLSSETSPWRTASAHESRRRTYQGRSEQAIFPWDRRCRENNSGNGNPPARCLDEASQPCVDELERDERAERERQEERTRARIRLLEEAVGWDKLALNGPAAAEKLRRIAAIAHPHNGKAQTKFLFDRAREY